MSKYLYVICALVGFVLGWFVTSSGYKAEIADMERENARAVEKLVESHNEKLENESRVLAQAISERDAEIDRARRLELDLVRYAQRLRDAQRASRVPAANTDSGQSGKRSDDRCGELLVRLSESGSGCCVLLGKLNADRNAVRKLQ